mmetsp:Transcript_3362/g.6414  ORF Transcript_3362/g.6414 Transcript_3362/m.6414 type:complete len:263 (+) Transcript_3362:1276-2064(+)
MHKDYSQLHQSLTLCAPTTCQSCTASDSTPTPKAVANCVARLMEDKELVREVVPMSCPMLVRVAGPDSEQPTQEASGSQELSPGCEVQARLSHLAGHQCERQLRICCGAPRGQQQMQKEDLSLTQSPHCGQYGTTALLLPLCHFAPGQKASSSLKKSSLKSSSSSFSAVTCHHPSKKLASNMSLHNTVPPKEVTCKYTFVKQNSPLSCDLARPLTDQDGNTRCYILTYLGCHHSAPCSPEDVCMQPSSLKLCTNQSPLHKHG